MYLPTESDCVVLVFCNSGNDVVGVGAVLSDSL